MQIDSTLAERGLRYGVFSEHAKIAQAIQDAYRVTPERWEKLPPVLKQGLTVIADKIARMLNGDHMYEDNLHDMVGYSKLMEDWVRLQNAPKLDISPDAKISGTIKAPEGSILLKQPNAIRFNEVQTNCVSPIDPNITRNYTTVVKSNIK